MVLLPMPRKLHESSSAPEHGHSFAHCFTLQVVHSQGLLEHELSLGFFWQIVSIKSLVGKWPCESFSWVEPCEKEAPFIIGSAANADQL